MEYEAENLNVGHHEERFKAQNFNDTIFNHSHIKVASKQIETIGYIHAGLFCQVLRVDRPSPYVTRVTRLESSNIGSDVVQLGTTVLLHPCCKYSSWSDDCHKREHDANVVPVSSISDRTNR
ncbi:hypothetical protein BDF21DRAFT_460697 [Thamnidium elegans]|nr:hypothetical protein BDF21DRAFT_460697 [Thamnidium elegans]